MFFQLSGILYRLSCHPLAEIFDLKREDFSALEVEERRYTNVFQVMRQTKRENNPF